MKWFEFSQNNSGGSFATDDIICRRVIFQAECAAEANKLALDAGIYFNGCSSGFDCHCCGDRWSEVDDSDGMTFPKTYGEEVFDTVEQYAQYMADNYGWTSPDSRIFYADGKTVSEVYTNKKNRA